MMEMGNDIRISVRVTEKEKERITALAEKCGLSVTEYMKQRALGYEPKPVPPGAFFMLLEKIGELQDRTASEETDSMITAVLKEITETILLPGKEVMKTWQSQDSGL